MRGGLKLPLAVLGLGGLGVVGVLVGTERGRAIVRQLAESFGEVPDRIDEWNDAAQREIENIQSAIDALAQALGVRPQSVE